MYQKIYIYDLTNCRVDADGEPIFWVSELGRFIHFDEMDYDTSAGEWYVIQ